jgi:hypothetical protein
MIDELRRQRLRRDARKQRQHLQALWTRDAHPIRISDHLDAMIETAVDLYECDRQAGA